MTNAVAPGGTLDKNAFLQLLVTQMRYQDPLQPQDNTAFLAQLAQFTALEQMTNLAQTEESVLTVTTASFETQLIGRTVEVKGSDGNPVTGVVSGVRWVNGDPQLVIGDATYSVSELLAVGSTSGETPKE